ncbi:hypothetical protein D3C81_1151530 [compost metagenome]
MIDGGLAGDLGFLPDFGAVAIAVLVDGHVAAHAVALVAIGIVAVAVLVDVHPGTVVQDLLGGAVVFVAVLGDRRVVVDACLHLFDVGLVVVTELEGLGPGTVLAVLIDEREVAVAFLLLQRLAAAHADGLAGMGGVERTGLLLVDDAAGFVQLFGVSGVETAGLILIDGAGGVVLNGSRIVPFTHLLLVGSTGRGQVLFHVGDVGGTVLELVGHAVIGHRLGTDNDQVGGGERAEFKHGETSKVVQCF